MKAYTAFFDGLMSALASPTRQAIPPVTPAHNCDAINTISTGASVTASHWSVTGERMSYAGLEIQKQIEDNELEYS